VLLSEFALLQQIRNEPSKNGKLTLLKTASPTLQRFLQYACDKYRVYRIKQIEQPETFNTVTPNLFEEFFILCDHLAKHEMGTNDAKRMIKNFLGKCTENSAAWFTKALLKDLDIGMDEKSINKVFPKLIPTFSVQLAYPIEDRWDKIKYPCLAEIKADGVRCIAVNDGEDVKFYSREGREFTSLKWLAKQVLQLQPGSRFVLDGEIDSIKFNPRNKTAVKNKDGNWKFGQSLSMIKTEGTPEAEMQEHLALKVWDILDHDTFVNQQKSPPLKDRKIQLFAMFERIDRELPNLSLMESWVAHSKEDLMRYFAEARANGEEGIMVKDPQKNYEYKRSDAILKLKEFYTEDLWVVDVQEGEGKYSGAVGALICSNHRYSAKVGTGMDDDTRLELFVEHLAGRLKGSWVEVSYQEVTADGSLRFPVFVNLRPDRERIAI
jgi:ATP-dependent DNA ligase